MADYTTEKELRALFSATAPNTDHKVSLESLISLHAQDFYKLYLGDDAEFSMTKFYEFRGEQSITTSPWSDPIGEETKYAN